jgi:hypothetical protein
MKSKIGWTHLGYLLGWMVEMLQISFQLKKKQEKAKAFVPHWTHS